MMYLDAYMLHNKGLESPPFFAHWCGLAGISCALGRRCWVDMKKFCIYPNVYIVLVAGSGKCRKSTSIDQIERLLYTLTPPPTLIAHKITTEAMIHRLRSMTVTPDGAILKSTAEGFVIVDEMKNFLNRRKYDDGLGDLLISLYDCKDRFEYETIGRGTELLEHCCLGLLAGTTIESLVEAIPAEAIGGGLTSRILFAYESVPANPIPFPYEDDHTSLLLRQELERMYRMEGEFRFDPEARGVFEKLYLQWHIERDKIESKHLSGYASRRMNHMIKLAMLYSASESSARIIKPAHLMAARGLLLASETMLPTLMNLITASAQGAITEIVLTFIRATQRMSRATLINEMRSKISARELDIVLETLIQSNQVGFVRTADSVEYFAKY